MVVVLCSRKSPNTRQILFLNWVNLRDFYGGGGWNYKKGKEGKEEKKGERGEGRERRRGRRKREKIGY